MNGNTLGRSDGLDAPVHDVQPRAPHAASEGPPPNVFWHEGARTSEARARQLGHAPLTVWLTGLSGAGKSTIAYALEERLANDGRPCAVLDGDNLRHRLNCDLGFSERDRRENIRRTAEVARLMNDAGLVVIASLVSPLRDDRAAARQIVGDARFVEVHVSTSLEVCEARDPKGLYRKARQGQIRDLTGIGSPYEAPLAPALAIDTAQISCAAAAALLHARLLRHDEERGDGDAR